MRLGSLAILGAALALAITSVGCGSDGKNGTSCTVVDNGNGTKTVTCGTDTITITDGAKGTDGNNGNNGNDGTSCTVKDNGDGTKTVTCGTASITITDGSNGTNGNNGSDGPAGWTPFSWANKNITATVTGSDASGKLMLDFTLVDAAKKPVLGVTTALMRMYLAELVPGATAKDSDQWKRWAYERSGTSGTPPVPYPLGTLVDLGAGHYTYTFATPLSSAPKATNQQRAVVRIRGLAGYNSINLHYDFIGNAPATAVAQGKDIVTAAACNACHGANINNHGHGGGYTEPKTCVICHSPLYVVDATKTPPETMADLGFDYVTMIHQIHSSKTAAQTGNINWSEVDYPEDIRKCITCHKGTQADNWKTKPTRAACDSCHTTIKFDNTEFAGIKAAKCDPGATPPVACPTDKTYTCVPTGTGTAGLCNYKHSAQANDQSCSLCHDPAYITDKHKLSPNSDASQRTMSATITAVAVDAATGKVKVNFTVGDGGTAVTDITKLTGIGFSLAKLVPGKGGASSHWQSYTSRFRTKDAAQAAVIQGYSESPAAGSITFASGAFEYTFALAHADTPGDIRTITRAKDISTVGATQGQMLPYPVSYEPSLLHRVGMEFSKVATPANIANLTNATFDFVPAGTKAPVTRNIVSFDACKTCHGERKLHKGFATQYCVTCHNDSTFDPYSGNAPQNVALQTIVHKIHMGKNLPSVLAGGSYKINGSHDYSAMTFPQPVNNCKVCHDESNKANADAAAWRTKPSRRACGTCHDGELQLMHMALNTFDPTPANMFSGDEVETCALCHGAGKVAPVEQAHYGIAP